MHKRSWQAFPVLLLLAVPVLAGATGCASNRDPADANLKISPTPRTYREVHPNVGRGAGQAAPGIANKMRPGTH
jgi:hypothetical protein